MPPTTKKPAPKGSRSNRVRIPSQRDNQTRYNDSTADPSTFDFAENIVAGLDRGIWHGIRSGRFRLAHRCSVCGRWLISDTAKRAGMGRRCAAKAVR